MKKFSKYLLAAGLALAPASVSYGQSFGVELHNTLMPASGAMGGASIARPQDLTSAINANPASLTQFRGTQFQFGGAWAEATMNMTQTGNIPLVGPPLVQPFSGKSSAPGLPIGNIGVTQDLNELGLPVTVGLGFVTTAGAFADFRQFPQSRGTNTGLTTFNMPASIGVDLTERLAVGASTSLGISFFDGPFVGAGGITPDYALRGTLGANYLLTDATTIGTYYQTEQAYEFKNAIVLNPGINQIATNVDMDLPQNIGIGFANTSFLDGRLLLATDVIYKYWEEADMYSAVYDNQLAVQLGTQLTQGKFRWRAGYVWAENPIDQTPGNNLGGVIQPGNIRAVRYSQALLAVTSQHRISAGFGIVDLLPGIDMDFMAGGMFNSDEQLGPFTSTSIESYWIGTGLTWRFGRGSCDHSVAPSTFSM